MRDIIFRGDTLRALRLAAGLTVSRLAERSGVSPSAIKYLESGARQPKRPLVLALAVGLDVEPAALTGPAEDIPAAS